jgi:hypothetical protein
LARVSIEMLRKTENTPAPMPYAVENYIPGKNNGYQGEIYPNSPQSIAMLPHTDYSNCFCTKYGRACGTRRRCFSVRGKDGVYRTFCHDYEICQEYCAEQECNSNDNFPA